MASVGDLPDFWEGGLGRCHIRRQDPHGVHRLWDAIMPPVAQVFELLPSLDAVVQT